MVWRLSIGLCGLCVGAALIAPSALLAQTTTSTNCYMIGTTEHCDSQTSGGLPSGINSSSILQQRQPDYVGSYANGYALGAALAAQREANRQAELLAAQREADLARSRETATDTSAEDQLAEARAEISHLHFLRSLDRAELIGSLSSAGKCVEARRIAVETPAEEHPDVDRALADEFCRPSSPPPH
jgi:hypothetical protein